MKASSSEKEEIAEESVAGEDVNRVQEWSMRWVEGRTGFHREAVNPTLLAHGEKLREKASTRPRILVPLCGKTLDMVWLTGIARQPVVGVEWVEQAVQEFYVEQDLEPRVIPERAGWTIYEHSQVTLHQADFFAVAAELGSFDAVYDRGSMIAIDPARRDDYVSLLSQCLPVGGRILLLATHYDQSEMPGPPFSLPPEQIEAHFRQGFDVDVFDDDDIYDPNGNFAARGLTWQRRSTTLLIKK
jgi:thiopurine S-methyltransferase